MQFLMARNLDSTNINEINYKVIREKAFGGYLRGRFEQGGVVDIMFMVTPILDFFNESSDKYTKIFGRQSMDEHLNKIVHLKEGELKLNGGKSIKNPNIVTFINEIE